jgi:hypothetical protein
VAIPDILAVRLIETVKDNGLSGSFLMLGRQRWIGRRRKRSAVLFDEIIAKYFPDMSEAELENPDNEYSENFFA